MNKTYKTITLIMVIVFIGAVILSAISCHPSLINVPNIPNIKPPDPTNHPALSKNEAMVDHLIKMFWFMGLINILFTWIAVLNIKRVLPTAKSWWVAIFVNCIVLGIWELFVYLGWSHTHWKDVFTMSLLSWYAQSRLYEKLDLKTKLHPH